MVGNRMLKLHTRSGGVFRRYCYFCTKRNDSFHPTAAGPRIRIRTRQQQCIQQLRFSSSPPDAFDNKIKHIQRKGAAVAHKLYNENSNDNDYDYDYDYFHREIATRLVDRLDDIQRSEGFPLALDYGAGPGFLYRAICADDAFEGEGSGGIGGVRKLVQLDSCEEMLKRDENIPVDGDWRVGTYRLCHPQSEEDLGKPGRLPFPDGTFDLVMSSLALHTVNDIPHLFQEIKRVLKPDGCFLFATIGGTTLHQLRSSLLLAEMEREGGVSPHVGPFTSVADVGRLLQNAGFALPTVDLDTVELGFPDGMVVMEHLQRMGEGNAAVERRKVPRLKRDTILAGMVLYQGLYPLEGEEGEGEERGVQVSVQVMYGIGWTPHASQPQPLERGSAVQTMKTISSSSSDSSCGPSSKE